MHLLHQHKVSVWSTHWPLRTTTGGHRSVCNLHQIEKYCVHIVGRGGGGGKDGVYRSPGGVGGELGQWRAFAGGT